MSSCEFAETCVFAKQSLEPLHCDPATLQGQAPSPSRTPLVPKLRGQFAEFLNEGSIERLRIFSSSTCVGLRYGHTDNLPRRLFLAVWLGQFVSAVASTPRHPSPLRATGLDAHIQPRADVPSCVLPRLQRPPCGIGILTDCPSPTAVALGLGPTNPPLTNIAEETWDLRRHGFSPCFSLLIPAFSLPSRPPVLTVWLHPTMARSPTTCRTRRHGTSAASVADLTPIIVGAESRSTGELLRTL